MKAVKKFVGRTGYQIFVDRFYRAPRKIVQIPGRIEKNWQDTTPNWEPDSTGTYQNDYFYCGNIKGIEEKLEYIQKMGFNLILLTPINEASTNHRYDVEDHLEVDSYIGNWEEFEELCGQAKSKDILIIVDIVFNHMGINSAYCKAKPEWFVQSYWEGHKNMLECNLLNERYQEYCVKVIENYLEKGASGIRLDLGETFPLEFMEAIKKTKNKYPNAIFINERWGFATNDKAEYIDLADSVMNYPITDAYTRWVVYGNDAHLRYAHWKLSQYPEDIRNILFNHLDTQDTPRAINMLSGIGMLEDPFCGAIWNIEGPWRIYNSNGECIGCDTYNFRKCELEHDVPANIELSIKRLKLASTMMYMQKGIPFTFAGTEAGLTGYKDPFNRKPYPWGKENKEIIEHYIKIGEMRKQHNTILAEGKQETYETNTISAIIRQSNTSRIIAVANNNTEHSIQISSIQYLREQRIENAQLIFQLEGSTKEEIKPLGVIILLQSY